MVSVGKRSSGETTSLPTTPESCAGSLCSQVTVMGQEVVAAHCAGEESGWLLGYLFSEGF